MTDPALLEVSDLEVRYGGVRAVNGMELTVTANTVVGLVGPNGAGKSTVIQALSGVAPASRGTINFDGHEIVGLPSFRIGRLGLMRTFQIAREWPALTLMENMLAAAVAQRDLVAWRGVIMRRGQARQRDEDRRRARDLLEEFGLAAQENDLAGRLSGGQKRLLEFARLMMAKPRMVLLDEPLAGVSPVMAQRIATAVQAFPRAGVTVLLVEHNLGFVDAVCDHVVVMAVGKPIASGVMSDLRMDSTVVDAYLGTATGV